MQEPLYIFVYKVADCWQYCGGGIVVIARDLDHARAVVVAADKEEHEKDQATSYFKSKYREPEPFVRTEEEARNCFLEQAFVLVGTFATTETEPRVVMNDWNYA